MLACFEDAVLVLVGSKCRLATAGLGGYGVCLPHLGSDCCHVTLSKLI